MIAAGVIGGVYLLGTVILFSGVKEKDGKLCLNVSGFQSDSFPFNFGKYYIILCIPPLVDPYALNADQAIPFFKGLGLTMKHGPYIKLTASFLLISTAVQVTSALNPGEACSNHSMNQSSGAKM